MSEEVPLRMDDDVSRRREKTRSGQRPGYKLDACDKHVLAVSLLCIDDIEN
jgi:hypothetical protein